MQTRLLTINEQHLIIVILYPVKSHYLVYLKEIKQTALHLMIYKATQSESVANGLDTLRQMIFFILVQLNSLLFPPVWAPESFIHLYCLLSFPLVFSLFLEACLHHWVLISLFYSTIDVCSVCYPCIFFYKMKIWRVCHWICGQLKCKFVQIHLLFILPFLRHLLHVWHLSTLKMSTWNDPIYLLNSCFLFFCHIIINTLLFTHSTSTIPICFFPSPLFRSVKPTILWSNQLPMED